MAASPEHDPGVTCSVSAENFPACAIIVGHQSPEVAMGEVTTTIDLLRHGEPVGGRKYRGQIDDPLSERGWTQMRDAVAGHCPWQQVVSSTLTRCAAFATELSDRHQLPLTFDERLKEIGFGTWEGRTADELRRNQPEAFARFYEDPVTYRPAGAETLLDFRERVIGAFDALVEQYPGQHVLVVAHAGVIRMVLRHVLEMPLERMFRIHVRNASISRVRIKRSGSAISPVLIFHDGQLA